LTSSFKFTHKRQNNVQQGPSKTQGNTLFGVHFTHSTK